MGLTNSAARVAQRRPLENLLIVDSAPYRDRPEGDQYPLVFGIVLNTLIAFLFAMGACLVLANPARLAALAGVGVVLASRVRPYITAWNGVDDLAERKLNGRSRASRHGRLFDSAGYNFAASYENVLDATTGLAPQLRRELRDTAGTLCRRGSMIVEAMVLSGTEASSEVSTALAGIQHEIRRVVSTATKAAELSTMLDRSTARRLEDKDRRASKARADLERLVAEQAARTEVASPNPTFDRVIAHHSAAVELGL